MLSVIGFILTISILVFIHELGHYLVARFFNVKIEEFSIGFGKELLGIIDKKGVKWKICLLPFGGYVKIYGYDRALMDASSEPINEKVAFFAKPCLERFLIVVAGPMINYILAIIIFASFYFHYGKVEIPPIIGEIISSSPAEKAGLHENDRIVKINSNLIKDFSELQNEILINQTKTFNLTLERENEIFTLSITPEEISVLSKTNTVIKKTFVGIIAKNEPIYINTGIIDSVLEATKNVIDLSVLTFKSLTQMIVGQRNLDNIAGPITIAKESGNSLKQGGNTYLLFIAMLSVNLGLLNLLPIPILDGGHLMFILYEAITGKLPNKQVKNILLQLGLGIIIFLFIISISNDIKNLF